MTVKIDIGADPGAVVSAFTRIKDGLRDARQAASDFAAIDMSHAELSALEDKIKRLTAALLEMQRASAGVVLSHGLPTPQPSAPGGAPGLPAWYTPPGGGPTGPGGPLSASPRGLPSWYSPPGGAPPAPPPAPALPPLPPQPVRRTPASSGDDDGGGAVSAIVGMLRGPIGFALSLAGVGGAAKMVGQAVGQSADEAVGNDRLLRTLRDSALDFDKLRDAARGAAGEIGATFGDMQGMTLRYARIAGSDVGSVVDRTKFAAGFARGYGMDQMEGVTIAARAENAGIDSKQLAAAIGDVLEQGGLQGRQSEVANAILKWGENASRQTVTNAQDHDFANMYIGLNATGMPGFRGANAEALISSMNTTISQGGAAGQASQIFASQALAANGVRSLYDQQYILAGGAFQNLSAVGGKNITVLDAELEKLSRDYGAGADMRKASALSGITGWNPQQSLEFLKTYNPGNSSNTYGALRKLNVDPGHMRPDALADISQIVGDNNGQLLGMRDKALKRSDLTDDERKELTAASGENLRGSLVRAYAAHGMDATQGSETVDANAKLSNSLTALGTTLLGPLNEMKGGIGSLLAATSKGVDILEKFLTTGTPGGGMERLPDGTLVPGGGGGGAGGGLIQTDGNTGFTSIAYRTRGGGAGFGGFGGGGGSGQPALSSPEMAARAKQAMDYFQSKGWSREAAAGIVANLIKESGLREGAIGDYGQAHGLMQEHPDRLADTAAGIGRDPTSSYMAGLEGVQYALTRGHDQGTRDTGIFLQGHHSARENGAFFSQHAERPADTWSNMIERGATAEELNNSPKMRGAGGGVTSIGYRGGVGRIEPLRVIHMLPNGRVLREQTLPITQTPRPEIA